MVPVHQLQKKHFLSIFSESNKNNIDLITKNEHITDLYILNLSLISYFFKYGIFFTIKATTTIKKKDSNIFFFIL